MEDEKILALYHARDERAITQTKIKYGKYCRTIAYRILRDIEDAEECENDTYFDAWRAIPPHEPPVFSVFLGMIARRIAIDKLKKKMATRRGAGEALLSLAELDECISDGKSIDEALCEKELAAVISRFLRALDEEECNVFLRRYYHFDTIFEISRRYDFSEGKVKMMLLRTREKLAAYLEKEGFTL